MAPPTPPRPPSKDETSQTAPDSAKRPAPKQMDLWESFMKILRPEKNPVRRPRG